MEAQARRGARADPVVTSAAAVQVLRAHAGLVLRHRRAGGRLLRALHAVLRPRAHRVPPLPRARCTDGGRRVRDAGERRRVPRAGGLRRRDRVFVRVSRIGATSVTYEFAAYRVPDDVLMVTAHQTAVYVDLATGQKCPLPAEFRETIAEFEGDDVESLATRSPPSRRSSSRAATSTTCCGGSSTALHEQRRLRLGRASSSSRRERWRSVPRPGRPTRPGASGYRWSGRASRSRSSRSTARRPDDTESLERVAVLVSGHCLVGWDTGGEPWES